MSKIARRKFIQFSAVAAAGALVQPGRSAHAEDMPKLSEDDPMAQAMQYVNDASTVDTARFASYAPGQACANCALYGGTADDAWAPCAAASGRPWRT